MATGRASATTADPASVLPPGNLAAGFTGTRLREIRGDGDWFSVDNQIVHASATTPVPLPATGWMPIAGLGGLAAMHRRRLA